MTEPDSESDYNPRSYPSSPNPYITEELTQISGNKLYHFLQNIYKKSTTSNPGLGKCKSAIFDFNNNTLIYTSISNEVFNIPLTCIGASCMLTNSRSGETYVFQKPNKSEINPDLISQFSGGEKRKKTSKRKRKNKKSKSKSKKNVKSRKLYSF